MHVAKESVGKRMCPGWVLILYFTEQSGFESEVKKRFFDTGNLILFITFKFGATQDDGGQTVQSAFQSDLEAHIQPLFVILGLDITLLPSDLLSAHF